MQAECDLQVVLLEIVGVLFEQVLEHAELERQEARTEHAGIKLEQFFERGVHLACALRLLLLCGLLAGLLSLLLLLPWLARLPGRAGALGTGLLGSALGFRLPDFLDFFLRCSGVGHRSVLVRLAAGRKKAMFLRAQRGRNILKRLSGLISK